MRRALLFVSFVSSVIAISVACGSSSDSNGSSGGPGDDASSGGLEGGSSGNPNDGSSSGSDSPPPPPPPFTCATLSPQPKLCEDFDDNTIPQTATTQTGAGATQGIVDTVSKSPPRSYEVVVPLIPAQISYSLLEMTFDTPTPPSKFTVSFDFNPKAVPAATGTLVVARVFLSQTHSVSIELTSEDGPVIREQEGGPPPTLDRASSKIASLPAANAWTRYKLTIDLASGKGTNAKLEANGAAVVPSFALTGTTNSDFFALNLGLQADAAFTAHYDNLVVDY
jgi:hypothetical protein